MALNFPASPTIGQGYPVPPVAGVPNYTWDGEKWTSSGVTGTHVLKAGDTMTGALTLPGAPTSNLHAATKLYVDGRAGILKYEKFNVSGVNSQALTPPVGAVALRLTGQIWPTVTAQQVRLQVAFQAGVWKTAAADYITQGFLHHTVDGFASVVSSSSLAGIYLHLVHNNLGTPILFDGQMQLKRRDNTSSLIGGEFRGITTNTNGFYHGLLFTYIPAATSGTFTDIVDIRINSTAADLWQANSFLHAEWL